MATAGLTIRRPSRVRQANGICRNGCVSGECGRDGQREKATGLSHAELGLAGLDGHAVEGEGAGDGQQNEERGAVHGLGGDDEEDSSLLVKLRLMNTDGFPLFL